MTQGCQAGIDLISTQEVSKMMNQSYNFIMTPKHTLAGYGHFTSGLVCFSSLTIRLIHESSITGSIARQPLLMADQACNCWLFFISNTLNGLIFNVEYDI